MNETRDRANGQYAYSTFEVPCVCGHALGSHTAAVVGGERPCLAGELHGESCDCTRFKKAPKPKAPKAACPYCFRELRGTRRSNALNGYETLCSNCESKGVRQGD